MIISDLLSSGSKILKSNKIETCQIDSELLLSNLLRTPREKIIVNSEENISETTANHFNKLITRRATGEPLAYILENKEFWSKNFFVNRNTLIPRPETELLCDTLIKVLKNKKPPRSEVIFFI